jgi:hypothetical protein
MNVTEPQFKNMPEAMDLIKKLCHRDARQRLGCGCEVMSRDCHVLL